METNMKEKSEKVIEILDRILNSIILHPEHLRIKAETMSRTMVISVQAHKGDTARIIGAKGVHFNALRAVLAAIGKKNGIDIRIPKISEPVYGDPDRSTGNPGAVWPHDEKMKILNDVIEAIFQNETLSVSSIDSGGVTTVEIICARNEKALAESICPQIKNLFIPVWRAFNRIIEITAYPVAESEAQPMTAAGRYAAE